MTMVVVTSSMMAGPVMRGAGAELGAIVDRRVGRLAVGREDRLAVALQRLGRRRALAQRGGFGLSIMAVERALDVDHLDRVVGSE